jgi:anti-sigma factor ChrR (cupin superfamily)
VGEEHLAEYASGQCDPVVAASAETHLVRCERCRAALAVHVDGSESDRRWARLADAGT